MVLDIEMGTDIRKAYVMWSMILSITNLLPKRLFTFVGESGFELVETLAEQISNVLLNEFNVPWLRLRVNKQGALGGVRDVGVIIERGDG